MQKEVVFYFHHGIEEKLESIRINEREVLPETGLAGEKEATLTLGPSKNRMMLTFKEGKTFSTTVPGGEWTKIIVNEAWERGRMRNVWTVIVLTAILMFAVNLLFFKNHALNSSLLSGIFLWVWFSFILNRNRYSVIFR